MPLDGTGYEGAVGRRKRLIAALRAQMPDGYTWDFGTLRKKSGCGTRGCAVGLAAALWPGLAADSDSVAEHIGLSGDEAWRVFGRGPGCLWPMSRGGGDEVTPGMVADALEGLR